MMFNLTQTLFFSVGFFFSLVAVVSEGLRIFLKLAPADASPQVFVAYLHYLLTPLCGAIAAYCFWQAFFS